VRSFCTVVDEFRVKVVDVPCGVVMVSDAALDAGRDRPEGTGSNRAPGPPRPWSSRGAPAGGAVGVAELVLWWVAPAEATLTVPAATPAAKAADSPEALQ
jgi:hypothetical protein